MGRARPLSGAKGSIHSIDEPPVVAVNFVVQDLTRWNGAMRIITWAQMAEWRGDTPPSLEKEPQEWLASRLWPLREGDCIIRDIRLWHGLRIPITEAWMDARAPDGRAPASNEHSIRYQPQFACLLSIPREGRLHVPHPGPVGSWDATDPRRGSPC